MPVNYTFPANHLVTVKIQTNSDAWQQVEVKVPERPDSTFTGERKISPAMSETREWKGEDQWMNQVEFWTGDNDVEVSFQATCPNAVKESTAFLIIGRNFPLTPEEEADRFELDELINAQDRPIVESQRPEELPLDLAAELHLKGPDAVAVAYRRFLAELGVDADAPEVSVGG